ncbi:MAG: hypothetical protein GY856_38110 [bacterium]|nr:hypothetical protein [bacterium]
MMKFRSTLTLFVVAGVVLLAATALAGTSEPQHTSLIAADQLAQYEIQLAEPTEEVRFQEDSATQLAEPTEDVEFQECSLTQSARFATNDATAQNESACGCYKVYGQGG